MENDPTDTVEHMEAEKADYIISGARDELTKSERIAIECVENDEPFFVLRAKDIFSVMVIRNYQKMVEDYGPYDQDFQIAVAEEVERMRDWQHGHSSLVGYPD